MIEQGQVRVNRIAVAKPAQTVKPGDVLTIVMGERVRVFTVQAEAARRGPFVEACQLYQEHMSASSAAEKDRA